MIINLVWDREHMTCGGYDSAGAGYTITGDRYTPLSRVHCNGCAEAAKLLAALEAARAELEAERRALVETRDRSEADLDTAIKEADDLADKLAATRAELEAERRSLRGV